MLSHLASAHLIPLLLPNKLENPSRSVRLSLDCQQVAFHEWEFFWPKDVRGVAKGDSSKLCKENTELQQSMAVFLYAASQFHSRWRKVNSSVLTAELSPKWCQALQCDSRPFISTCSPCHVWRSSDMEGWQALALEQKIPEARCLPCNREAEV